ncbi:hypothetical protein PC117_g10745 [Phytophthora cactorum]|uniref:Uncharacterized protein n=1 Tax=Phytophthora cactorum TaxID=29920 RepID=A0A8T1DJM9_9STRA|nr:hypothetical protein PC117_g10745 [Phytophthora cactorum]
MGWYRGTEMIVEMRVTGFSTPPMEATHGGGAIDYGEQIGALLTTEVCSWLHHFITVADRKLRPFRPYYCALLPQKRVYTSERALVKCNCVRAVSYSARPLMGLNTPPETTGISHHYALYNDISLPNLPLRRFSFKQVTESLSARGAP